MQLLLCLWVVVLAMVYAALRLRINTEPNVPPNTSLLHTAMSAKVQLC